MKLHTYPCRFGFCCITTADDGWLCGVELAKTSEEAIMLASLRFAKLGNKMHYEPAPSELVAQVLQAIDDGIVDPNIPIRYMSGTWLQREVWLALRETHLGEKISYKELAAKVGYPSSIRPVASAVGENPLAVIVPCHRAVRSDGSDSGFRWGIDVKRQLLLQEELLVRPMQVVLP